MAEQAAIHIRPYRPADRDQVMALAPRLTEWVASWRDPAAVLPAVQGWVRGSIEALGQPGHAVYVAADGEHVVGLVTVSEHQLRLFRGPPRGPVLAAGRDAGRTGAGPVT